MRLQGRGGAVAKRLWRVRGAGPAGGLRRYAAPAILGAALCTIGPTDAAPQTAPTPAVAGKCRVLAYKVYPRERPGSAPGSGARYALFKDCIDKGGQVDETTLLPRPPRPPPQLGPPPESQPPRQLELPPDPPK
jgi:hypothetical protein